jgi:hypothetical protein|tara:strand:- start:1074 stop:1253 length:180 start_codon:yes stop_codon:yes gene_type:complete
MVLNNHTFSLEFSVDSLHEDPWMINEDVILTKLMIIVKQSKKKSIKDKLKHIDKKQNNG